MKGKTYAEIKHQYEALKATSALIAERREALCDFLESGCTGTHCGARVRVELS